MGDFHCHTSTSAHPPPPKRNAASTAAGLSQETFVVVFGVGAHVVILIGNDFYPKEAKFLCCHKLISERSCFLVNSLSVLSHKHKFCGGVYCGRLVTFGVNQHTFTELSFGRNHQWYFRGAISELTAQVSFRRSKNAPKGKLQYMTGNIISVGWLFLNHKFTYSYLKAFVLYYSQCQLRNYAWMLWLIQGAVLVKQSAQRFMTTNLNINYR